MLPTGLSPMLATTGALPVSDGWAYEVKWDGVRALVAITPHGVTATSRNGNDVTGGYPELQALVGPEVLLDGELVALGSEGLPDFGLLQKRMHVRSPSPALVAAAPVSFVPFDVLHLGELSLLDQPYDTRRGALDDLGLDAPAAFLTGGVQVLASSRAQGLEGVVAKQRDSPYLPGRRSVCWVKVKHVRRQSVLVCGWKPGEGGRAGRIGSLLVGVRSGGQLVYAGHVGTGFSAAALALLGDLLAPLARPTPAYDGPVPQEHARLARWVDPVLVGEVELTAWTRDGRLRHPSWKGLRDDLDPATIEREP